MTRDNIFSSFLRTREHDLERCEPGRLGLLESVLPCEERCFPDISQQHVGASDFADVPTKGIGNSFFEQPLFQSDSEIT